ncbi:CBS domain-containing protein [Tranquillimonas alkanivorans]|uniref:CBS domain-containing protein n=1 Tax=Tranquillimonas alkanivorans TaxID=441119 RepID=A0A1I5RED4_9RHOB|nr:CBS domain-containing protein [Tranquillimonas alkanivorans]SFP56835.1 CBS domain-containing protein [Tranquillimonas alkanivorans]
MLVHQILKSKSDTGVVTLAPGTSVSDAAALLAERRIGAVVISKDGTHPEGILSERDIVRELGRRGPTCLGDTVDEMMTRELVGCTRDETADAVLAKMTEGRFRHIPVMDGSEMVGLISIGDVVKARLSELSMERDALQDMVMGH